MIKLGDKYPQKIGLFTESLSGHRKSYLDFASRIFHGERIGFRQAVLQDAPVIFLMADEKYYKYFIASILRSIRGKTTVGLMFRPHKVLDRLYLKNILKLSSLLILKRLRKTHSISIIPTPIVPTMEKIIDDWIYDFQYWDLSSEDHQEFSKIKAIQKSSLNVTFEMERSNYHLAAQIGEFAKGRKLLVSIGSQHINKGFDAISTAIIPPDWCVVIAGKVAENQLHNANALAESGALIIDRFITDKEILECYASATCVWCYYNPTYDQASGILGRSIQLKVPVLLRSGSIGDKFCAIEDIYHLSADGNEEISQSLMLFDVEKSKLTPKLSSKYSAESLEKLKCYVFDKDI